MLCKGCGNKDAWKIWTWDGGHYCDTCSGASGLPRFEGRDYTEKAILNSDHGPKFKAKLIDNHRKDVMDDRRKNPSFFKRLDAERGAKKTLII